MTLTDRAMAALREAGIDARKPANYQGECKAPYVVVQDAGTQAAGKTTCKRVVVLYGYAPYNQPQRLPELLTAAKAAMGAVPALRLTAQSEETVNDAYKAVAADLTYTALCAV